MESLRRPDRTSRAMATLAQPSRSRSAAPADTQKHSLPALMLGAIGVVYGDIGTSPLYAMKESFIGPHPLAVDPLHIFGVLSLIFWSLMLVVTVKYVFVAMRADNQGRRRLVRLAGADLAQPRRAEMDRRPGHARRARDRPVLRRRDDHAGDLGAVGGRGADRRQGEPRAAGHPDRDRHPDRPVPGPVARDRAGRRACSGRSCWSISPRWRRSASTNIVEHPEILGDRSARTGRCNSSLYDPKLAFLAMGSVFLAVTGAETLYADMGHFGRKAIGISWLTLVYPCLMLNYMGQGALLLGNPAAVENPFYLMAPEWARLPLVFIATAATIIASQAVISGAFSVTHQAVQLGFLPRLRTAAHQRQGGRADLHPGGQLGAAGDGRAAGPRLRQIDQPRLGLRHLGQRHDDHHHVHARRPDLPGVEVEPGAGDADDRPVPRWSTAPTSPRTSPRSPTAAGSRWSSRR